MIADQAQCEISTGMSAIDLVSAIAARHPGWTFTFVTFEVEPGSMEAIRPHINPEFLDSLNSLWDRVGNDTIRGLGGIVPRDRNWEVGWNSILAQSIDERSFAASIDIVLRHEEGRQAIRGFEMESGQITPSSMARIVESLPRNHVLAFCSLCKTPDHEILHLPMMDFRCAPNPYFQSLVRICLDRLGQRDGAIVKSGRSYHFYGLKPLGVGAWREFMARCLLLAPLTDARYIAHRLVEGLCVLRLSVAGSKSATPTIDCVLTDTADLAGKNLA
ncbi:MAG TPA: hypothetical protein VN924_33530 [Bryobacteraceae bacterium]|nr:hypothetical protein [Bryobacteraceae bacterium]